MDAISKYLPYEVDPVVAAPLAISLLVLYVTVGPLAFGAPVWRSTPSKVLAPIVLGAGILYVLNVPEATTEPFWQYVPYKIVAPLGFSLLVLYLVVGPLAFGVPFWRSLPLKAVFPFAVGLPVLYVLADPQRFGIPLWQSMPDQYKPLAPLAFSLLTLYLVVGPLAIGVPYWQSTPFKIAAPVAIGSLITLVISNPKTFTIPGAQALSDDYKVTEPQAFSVSLWRSVSDNYQVVAPLAFSLLVLYVVVGPLAIGAPAWRLPFGQTSQARLPPGPSGLPVIGNLLQVLKARRDPKHGAHYLSSLSKHGEMVTLQMGSSTWIMLNSDRVVTEIIAKRQHITHERPFLPVASGLMSKYMGTVLRQSEGWAAGRKLMHKMLSGTSMREYARIEDQECMRVLVNYLNSPDTWYLHHYQYSFSVMHRIVAGELIPHTTQQRDDFRRITREFITSINASLLDFFPWMTNLPEFLQPGRKHWQGIGQKHRVILDAYWEHVKEHLARGQESQSFVTDTLLQDEKYGSDDEEAMYLATALVAAGSDNTRMTLNVFVMAILNYPETFKAARKELDAYLGSNAERLPVLSDLEQLPYITALIKECLRWRPVLPLIPQHQLTKDLEFDGFFFPAGTDFVVNSLAVNNECEDPTAFKPERWLDDKIFNVMGGLWQFGGGRRVCVGYGLAHQELFLAFSRLIYCFDYKANGHLDTMLLNHSAPGEPFPVKVSVRSQAHADLIAREAKERIPKTAEVDV